MAAHSGNRSWNIMQAVIGLIVVCGLFGVLTAWMLIAVFADTTKLDPGLMALLNILTGCVVTAAIAVVNYYFGSSKSSADKEENAKIATRAAADAQSTTSATLDKVISGTGNGTGDPHATTVKVTPPPPPDSVNVETTITKTIPQKKGR